jgi:hypothetical protein
MEGNFLHRIPFIALALTAGLTASNAGAQTMTEFGAATAGSVVGGASGKSVSDGINSIFGKVNQQTAKAAGTEAAPKKKEAAAPAAAPAVAPSATTSAATGMDAGVPLPPPARTIERQAPSAPLAANIMQPPPFVPGTMADALPSTPIPPPPTMTPESLRGVTIGMSRAEVLKLGDPSSRIAMIEDGHMVETFSYRANRERFGFVKVQDGSVAKVEVK